jgi:hypothetical protein
VTGRARPRGAHARHHELRWVARPSPTRVGSAASSAQSPTLPSCSCRELSLFFFHLAQDVERLQRAGEVRLIDASANGKLCRDPAPVKLTYASACNHAWLLQVTDVRGLVAQECDREGACGCILRALHDQGLCCLVCSQAPLRLLAACPVWIAHTHVHDGPGKRMGDATKGGR